MEKPPHKATGSSSKPYATPYPPPPPEQQKYPAGYGYQPQPPLPFGYPQGQPAYGYPPQSGHGYLPQHGNYGYRPPQHGGYGYEYPPQQGWYGCPPQGPRPGKSKFGIGFVAGLLRGDFGGLWIANMVSDSFDDDNGFDFS